MVCDVQCLDLLKLYETVQPWAVALWNTQLTSHAGIKEYSDWPTIPQLYVDKEFVGGCDILINMHKDGSLAELLAEKKVIVEEDADADVEGQQAQEARDATEQSTGGRSKDAKGESS